MRTFTTSSNQPYRFRFFVLSLIINNLAENLLTTIQVLAPIYRSMKIICLFITFTLLVSCRVKAPQIQTISPKEEFVSVPYQDIVSTSTKYDTIDERSNSFMDFKEV